jgi:hypothetical protein
LKETNKELLEAAGVIAVVTSLIFVGVQLYFDRNVAMADSYSNAIESRKADARAKLESDTFMRLQDTLWELGERPDWWSDVLESTASQSLETGSEIMAQFIGLELRFLDFDSVYYRHQQGLITDLYWSGFRNAIKGALRDPYTRAIYVNRPSILRPTIQELMTEIDSENGT